MKHISKKLTSLKIKDGNLKKLKDVKNVENIKSLEIKSNYMDLVTEDVWDFMNDFNDEDLKCDLD